MPEPAGARCPSGTFLTVASFLNIPYSMVLPSALNQGATQLLEQEHSCQNVELSAGTIEYVDSGGTGPALVLISRPVDQRVWMATWWSV